jgi:hypothetical protein
MSSERRRCALLRARTRRPTTFRPDDKKRFTPDFDDPQRCEIDQANHSGRHEDCDACTEWQQNPDARTEWQQDPDARTEWQQDPDACTEWQQNPDARTEWQQDPDASTGSKTDKIGLTKGPRDKTGKIGLTKGSRDKTGKIGLTKGPRDKTGKFAKTDGRRRIGINRDRRRIFVNNRWRTLIPLIALGTFMYGDDTYYADGYVSMSEPVCTGYAEDGSRLRWMAVPTEDGGSEYQWADSSSEGNTRAVSSMFRVGHFVQQGVENLVGRCVVVALARP